jgi:mannose-6-phosphate isomerase-like protein (cupin superfamily)/uncharacterized protein YndB with AHSA1/START domain
MASAGDVIENPVTGQRIVFEATARETKGELLRFRSSGEPQGLLAQEHVHPRQSERHEIISGQMVLSVAGQERLLGPGDVVDVPAGTPHRTIGRGPVEVRFEVRPALRQEMLVETFSGLARDGKVSTRGAPNLLQLAVIAREFEQENHGTRPPLAMQRALLGPLAAVGRRRGYRAWYPQYSDPEVARLASETPRPGHADMPGYVFIDEWDVDAPIEAVFDALADPRTYPQWWRPVYLRVETDGPPAVGRISRHHFKARLPYTLHLTLRVTGLERPTQIEAEVEGDLSGRSRWTLTPVDGRVHLRWDWRVDGDRAFLRILSPVLRPLFRYNHQWAVARAKEGLEPYAREAK